MATKMKGFFKGFKYISQILVYKEHELEIGYPTDVKHLAHIGWDGSSINAPSWMHEYKTSSDFSSTSLSNLVHSGDSSSVAVASWSSQDFSHSDGLEPLTEMFEGPRDLPKVPKKSKRKKSKSSSSKSKSSFSLDGAEAWEVRS